MNSPPEPRCRPVASSRLQGQRKKKLFTPPHPIQSLLMTVLFSSHLVRPCSWLFMIFNFKFLIPADFCLYFSLILILKLYSSSSCTCLWFSINTRLVWNLYFLIKSQYLTLLGIVHIFHNFTPVSLDTEKADFTIPDQANEQCMIFFQIQNNFLNFWVHSVCRDTYKPISFNFERINPVIAASRYALLHSTVLITF